MRWDIALDLGTDKLRIASYKQGAVLETAARLAFREGRDIPLCCGDVAYRISGRCCAGVEVTSPLRDGVLESNLYADRLLRWAFHREELAIPARRFGVLIACAPFARPVQQEALMTAALDAGAAEVALIRADAAAAIGAGLDLNAPEAKLVVDVGAGKVTATLFTLGRVAGYGYLPYGLDRIDQRIQRSMRTDYGYRIGMRSAREIKHTLGTALPERAPSDVIMRMTGFSTLTRLPESFDIETAPVLHACEEVISEIAGLCLQVISDAPDALSADLNDAGAVLVGAGAEMAGLDKRIGDTLGLSCRIADAPSKCCVRGLAVIMRESEKYASTVLARSKGGNLK